MEQNIVGTISVEDLRLFIKKGLFDTELLTENQFLVSVHVSYKLNDLSNGEYLDYSNLASILQTEMFKDVHLLETIAENCIKTILAQWPFVCAISIKIQKIHPDFKQLNLQSVSVKMDWSK